MADEEQLAILRQGSEAWNNWRQKHPGVFRPDLSGAELSRAELGDANLSGAELSRADLSSANLSGADLSGAELSRADLSSANLSGADLTGADLSWAELGDADLTGADLSGAELVRTELGGAILSGANLSRAQLSGAELGRAKLSGAKLSEAHLYGAELRDADLTGADLSWARLYGANLRGANLRGANLTRASLCDAHLIGADLSEAQLYETILADLDLSSCKGLDSCEHHGPSTIDHRTLQRSGTLPLPFLRGVGLPDNLIDCLPSLLNQPIQFYRPFISHSSKDEAFVEQLYADLQDSGVRCYCAPHDMPIGAKILDAIDEAIRLRDKVLLVLSEGAIASDWVEGEVTRALDEERERKRPLLVPIRIDDAVCRTEKAWARLLRGQRNIGDFIRWKEPDAYRKKLDQLLRDLKVEAAGPADRGR